MRLTIISIWCYLGFDLPVCHSRLGPHPLQPRSQIGLHCGCMIDNAVCGIMSSCKLVCLQTGSKEWPQERK